jgi:hypothetical protein
MALQNGGEHDPELRTARLEMSAEWLRRFPGEDGLITGNFRRALADSYFGAGQQETTDELYRSWLEEDPAWGWGWIGWADCYTPFGPGKTQDYPRRKRSCTAATPFPESGKPSTSRDGWRSSARRPDGTSHAPAEAARSSRSAAAPQRKADRPEHESLGPVFDDRDSGR